MLKHRISIIKPCNVPQFQGSKQLSRYIIIFSIQVERNVISHHPCRTKKRYEKEIDLYNQSYEKRPRILFTSFRFTFSLHTSLTDKFHTYEKSLKHEYYYYVYMVSFNVDKAPK